MKSLYVLVLPLLLVTFLVTGCDSTVTGEGETTNVTLHLQPVFDGAPLSSDPSTTYDLNGTTITFTSARVYISEIELVKADTEAQRVVQLNLQLFPLTVGEDP